MTTTPYPELQQIILEETDNGRGIVRFLFQAMQGEFLNFTPNHQLMAGRVLAILGVEQGIEFVEANRNPRVPGDSAQRRGSRDEAESQLSAAERELADYARKVSNNGRRMVRFFLEAMDGVIKSFRPSLRIAAAKELIGYGFPLLTPNLRRKTATPRTREAPAPQSATQSSATSASVVAVPTIQSKAGHPELCSCSSCERAAIFRYAQVHCIDGEEIYQSIVRRAMTATSDGKQRVAEVARIWNEYNEFVRNLCPGSGMDAFPGWLSELMENDDSYPHGYNPELVKKRYDFWTCADMDDEILDCDCYDCGDDHERDDYGYCLCEKCYEDEDDP